MTHTSECLHKVFTAKDSALHVAYT